MTWTKSAQRRALEAHSCQAIPLHRQFFIRPVHPVQPTPLWASLDPINIKLSSKCECRFKEIKLRAQAVAQALGGRAAFPFCFHY